MHPQIYGGPGDFDSNGVVDGEDLTHATLGFNTRFGDDLDGSDFLVWQRNFGNSLVPEEIRGGQADPVDEIDAKTSIAAVSEDDDEPRFDVFAYGSLAGLSVPQAADATRKSPRSRKNDDLTTTSRVVAKKPIAWEARDSAFALLAGSGELIEDKYDATSPWDDAFADFGLAVVAVV
jgi:hypothetical protein